MTQKGRGKEFEKTLGIQPQQYLNFPLGLNKHKQNDLSKGLVACAYSFKGGDPDARAKAIVADVGGNRPHAGRGW